MLFRSAAALIASFILTVAALAAPVKVDLGDGLVYFRVHALPADLPGADQKAGATVIDLRYVSATPDPTAALQAWLRFHATAATPVLVLVNADTGKPLRAAIARLADTPGLLVIGSDLGAGPADIKLEPTPADERAAYDAFDHGTPAATLITQNTDKPRHDEASLAQSTASADDDAATDADNADSDASVDSDATPPPPPPFDLALQRAVDIHRTLLALGRLPARS
jgi:hypothetical protein